MGTQGYYSSCSVSGARPHSTGVLADDCPFETLSNRGVRKVKGPARASVGKALQGSRSHSLRMSREGRRVSASAHQHIKGGVSETQNQGTEGPSMDNRVPKQENEPPLVHDCSTHPDSTRPCSTPMTVHYQIVTEVPTAVYNKQAQESLESNRRNEMAINQDVVMEDAEPTIREMFKQLETHVITEEQLINEVRGIYTGLVQVEKKCIEVDRQQAESKTQLSKAQWQVLVSVHRTLLHEHHDFFLASQHPSASRVLKQLATKYAMPARMWRYGVHSFLELLRQNLSDSMEYMLDFIYLSYSMMTLLLESVPDFKETWIECLGDLARYRMAVEEYDKKDRELWAGVSRYWYNQDAGGSTSNGRIQHHLAVLARPDVLQQFFHYTKALVSVSPFPNALHGMKQLVAPLLSLPTQEETWVTSFVTTHSALFMQPPASAEDFAARANGFLAKLRMEINRIGRNSQQGVQMTSCNICAIFQYGSQDGVMEKDFTLKSQNPTVEERLLAMQWASGARTLDESAYADISSQLAFRASSLTFHTLIIMLGQVGDPNMYPSVHISMAFISCLTVNPAAIQRLEPLIPWSLLAAYLNTLFRVDDDISKIENESFPLGTKDAVQLPEDFLIRGQAWSQVYFPAGFFEEAPTEDERLSIDAASTVSPRRHRCLWLGVRIAKVCYPLFLYSCI
ncbi:DNA/RNA-binding domain E.t1.c1-type [Penicillium paradoxum]|uniref:DNA/RNA-binding domain E.t1.c1-type n=1 Tax=Penicillium paradoxum TaxID=176176 RepID=UPI002548C888|nr:DNA/RNA-binding domain E.t1.c1-type [Penicillium paradoxum]KAJ5794815.1 DNA/RNA-binding domain E.t1.c1-type [Penicillium paradoxum]